MSELTYRDIGANGVWNQNPGLVQLLGLCPLLAISGTVVNSLSLGLATAFVMALTSLAVSLVRHLVPPEIRIPVFVLMIATLVTVVQLLMNAYLHELYLVLGIFVPLIVTNCIVLARAEAFASKQHPLAAAYDGLMMGLGLALVLTLLGAMRELAAKGTLLANIHLALGEAARSAQITVIPDYPGFLLAALPPGAFIGLGLMIAAKNAIDRRRAARAHARGPAAAAT
jgi:electron transport complex protein RnfE